MELCAVWNKSSTCWGCLHDFCSSFWWTLWTLQSCRRRFQLALGNIMRQQMDRHGLCFLVGYFTLQRRGDWCLVCWALTHVWSPPGRLEDKREIKRRKTKRKRREAQKQGLGLCGPGCCGDVATFWAFTISETFLWWILSRGCKWSEER